MLDALFMFIYYGVCGFKLMLFVMNLKLMPKDEASLIHVGPRWMLALFGLSHTFLG